MGLMVVILALVFAGCNSTSLDNGDENGDENDDENGDGDAGVQYVGSWKSPNYVNPTVEFTQVRFLPACR